MSAAQWVKTIPMQLETRRAASSLLCTSVGQTASVLATDSTGKFVLSGLSVSRHIYLVVCVCVRAHVHVDLALKFISIM